MPTSNLDPGTPVQFLKGVGPQRAALLAKLGIETVEDLVRHFPRDYQDRRQVTPIGELRPETSATVRSSVLSVRTRKLRGRRSVVTAQLSDGTGTLEVEFWQQKWRAKQLAEGREVILFGRVTWDKGPKMTGPDLETAVDDGLTDPSSRKNFSTDMPGKIIYLKTGIDGNLYYIERKDFLSINKIVFSDDPFPMITDHPDDLTAMEMDNVKFYASSTGSFPLTYQWLHNGIAITNPSTITASLKLNNINQQ